MPAEIRTARVLNKRVHGIPPGACYIGRPSPLGNPFIIGRDGTRNEVVAKYRHWLWQQMQSDPSMLRLVAELAGRDLVCWCAPLPCHGDVLVAASRWAARWLRQSPRES